MQTGGGTTRSSDFVAFLRVGKDAQNLRFSDSSQNESYEVPHIPPEHLRSTMGTESGKRSTDRKAPSPPPILRRNPTLLRRDPKAPRVTRGVEAFPPPPLVQECSLGVQPMKACAKLPLRPL